MGYRLALGQRPAAAAVHLLHDARPADQRLRHPGRLHRHECRPGADRARARTKSPASSPTKSPTSPSATCCARVERAKRDQLPIMLAMLGAIIAAQSSNSRNSGDAIAGRRDRQPGAWPSSGRSTTPAPTKPKPTASACRRCTAPATTSTAWRISSSAWNAACAAIPAASTHARLPADPPGHDHPHQRGPRPRRAPGQGTPAA